MLFNNPSQHPAIYTYAMAGRRPKPTALKQLQGNPGHRPLPANEWHPEKGCPEMPRYLRKAAKRAWHHWVAILLPPGILTKADGPALAMACDAFADWEEAQKDLLKNGMILDSPVLDKENIPILFEGRMLIIRKENPAVGIKCKAMKLMKTFLVEFGLTPASRPKIKGEKEEVDPMKMALDYMPDDSDAIQPADYSNN